MRLIDADKIQEEIKKCDGVACSDYGRGICAGIHRALQKLDEAETFDLEKHDLEIRADERAIIINILKSEEFADLYVRSSLDKSIGDVLEEILK